MINVKIIADSINSRGKRITTFELVYPRFIHAELMTHRVFSRNASSSRAIPVKNMIGIVRDEPAMPIHWGKNKPGMQADAQLEGNAKLMAVALWLEAAQNASDTAEAMMNLGLHKQVANRILEPFQHIHVVLTATEFDNWNALRCHPDAQPEIQALAMMMREGRESNIPSYLKDGGWHLPYVTDKSLDLATARKVSAARCCRVSYLKHDGTTASIAEDVALCDRLAGSVPIHASPFEHQAVADASARNWDYWGNFVGWAQNRKLIEHIGV